MTRPVLWLPSIDPRLVYLPLDRNIGRAANHNRLMELAETEFLVLTGDDDELHPDHLSLTIDALRRFPSVGVAHAGCAIVDIDGNTFGSTLSNPRRSAPSHL